MRKGSAPTLTRPPSLNVVFLLGLINATLFFAAKHTIKTFFLLSLRGPGEEQDFLDRLLMLLSRPLLRAAGASRSARGPFVVPQLSAF